MHCYSSVMSYRQSSASQHYRSVPGTSRGAAQPRTDSRARPSYRPHPYHPPPPPQPPRSGKPECSICSYRQPVTEKARAVNHKHFSTRFMQSVSTDSAGNSFCSTCKKVHHKYPTDRVKLCLSDSTLHEFFTFTPPPPRPGQKQQLQNKGDNVHVDYVTIPGSKVEDLQQAFRLEYEKETRGIDVLVVAGLNNLLKGDKVEELFAKFGYFRDLVEWQATKYHPAIKNTFAVTTLLYAPQLCWFPDDGPPPSPTYRNMLQEMQWLNNNLLEFNTRNGVARAPHVHKFGIRIDNKSDKDMYGNVQVRHRTTHKWEQWREEDKGRMLHLCDLRRLLLGRTVNKYFQFNT